MEQPGKKADDQVETTCPACGMPWNEWPEEGVSKEGTLYCCEGCANGTGCTCRKRAGQTTKRTETIGPSIGPGGCGQPTPPDREH